MDETIGVGVGPAERAHHAGGDGPTPEPRRRMSARRKQETVLRLLRGEGLELVSRELAVTAAELSGWRDPFLAAGEAALKSRPADARDAAIDRLQAKVGELTMTAELLEAKIGRLEVLRPLGRRRSRPTPRDGSRGDPGGDGPAGLALHRPGLRPLAGHAPLGRCTGDPLPPPPPHQGGRAQAPRPARGHGGRGPAGGGPPASG